MKPLYKINEQFFKIIDTEDKSYFLGLIFADGYLHEKRKYMSLSLQDTDKDILEKLSLSIETNKPLQFIKRAENNTKNQYRLSITRKIIINDLINLGVYQRKSLTSTPNKLKFNNDNLIKHFIRGYFDGDGCFTFSHVRNTINSSISIVCTNEFYDFFSEYIFHELSIKTTKGKRFEDNKNCFDLRISGSRNVLKFLNFIYSDSKIFLNRKRNKYIEFIQFYERNVNKSMGDKVTIKVNNLTFSSYKDASIYFNIPLTTFKRKVNSISNYLGYNWLIERK